jgi:UTP--glucose-1-phosphate uridylyltransferase
MPGPGRMAVKSPARRVIYTIHRFLAHAGRRQNGYSGNVFSSAHQRTIEKDNHMPTTIRKAVIPAAGLGSRLLPLTKAIPKEMLPVGDKPVIEHTVRELVNSGITDITIVVSGGKSLIQDHFRPNPALVDQLRSAGKDAYADAVEEIGELSHRGHITYLDQHGPYGNGTPVLNAARSFGNEPVLVLWPDDVFVAEVPRAQQLIRAYEQT